MDEQTKDVLVGYRDELERRVAGLRCDAAILKSGDVVDDYACDSVAWGAREIALTFNAVALLLDLKPIEVPEELEASPYQEDGDEG